MYRTLDISSKSVLVCGLALAMLVPLDRADAKKSSFTVLHAFTGGSDGSVPAASLIADKTGNLYSTTEYGGPNNAGTVFKLAPDGTETVLYAFKGGSDGSVPYAGLISDKAGNLYSTTGNGGGAGCGDIGCGTVFKLAPDGTETVLYAFTGGSDGGYPSTGVIADKKGNLYGTTWGGGTGCDGVGCGTVFKLSPNGTETVLYAFKGGSDSGHPLAGLIADKNGNLYGTNWGAGTGCGGNGCGTVFKVAPNGTQTVLHSFTGGSDGGNLYDGLIADEAGNLYGTTYSGGTHNAGTVFKLAPDGTETVLYSFTGGSDGGYPFAGLIMDKKGNLYSTTFQGGTGGFGTVFKLAPNGTETVLYSFTGGNDGGYPEAGLITNKADLKRYIYGTTVNFGTGQAGTVFRLKK